MQRTVLLIEPNDDNRNMYRWCLRRHGLNVLTALGSDEALRKAVRADVIVTSIRLPGAYDGIELVHRLRRPTPTADRIVIVLIGDAFVHHRRLAVAAGLRLLSRQTVSATELGSCDSRSTCA